MKEPADAWDHGHRFHSPEPPEHQPPFEDQGDHQDDSPEFAAIRRIELLSRLHHMAFRAHLQDDTLPPAQAGALRVIVRCPGLSQRELADKLHIKRATATVMLQKMERSGIIDRRADLDDQRISRIYPTEMACLRDAENQQRVADYFSRCFHGITDEEFDSFNRILSAMEKNLRDLIQDFPDSPRKE